MKQFLKVALKDEVISGTSSNGVDWEKQTVVFDTVDATNTKLAIDFMGERKTKISKALEVGQICEVSFTVESHEVNGKWFTNVNAISVAPYGRIKKEGDSEAPADCPPDEHPLQP